MTGCNHDGKYHAFAKGQKGQLCETTHVDRQARTDRPHTKHRLAGCGRVARWTPTPHTPAGSKDRTHKNGERNFYEKKDVTATPPSMR